ncbi:hypothetical protein [Cutibacterium modestum]|uniref:Uncharacterized protein n=1 Tax=Cutibacterium modestum HL044PA1 TaxID=765109 RepID=A0ABP2K8T7_9ACTN|nr:hypothetical protein [Cutibacterium modestum]EFS93310.1 hypothetical protein HMPREF9607_00523 [Cutibacterium modestum HL044PA1]MCP2375547.1 spermidine/putrescine import ATP-binding protein potA [Cutibacterium modestum 28N]MCP2378719.1 spermidine/putrescine import ATP-binding protein potA [Cutibacterium modestum 31N]
MTVVEQIAARIVVLSRGRIVEQGPTPEVLSHLREEYFRSLVGVVPDSDPAIQRARRARVAAKR